MSVIQMINKLRLFCNLGVVFKPATLAAPQHTQYSVTPERDDSTESVVASEFALGGTNCEGCGNMIDIPDKVDSKDASPCAYYTNCRKLFCLDYAILYQSQSVPSCSCDPAIICILHPLSFYLVPEGTQRPNRRFRLRAHVKQSEGCDRRDPERLAREEVRCFIPPNSTVY